MLKVGFHSMSLPSSTGSGRYTTAWWNTGSANELQSVNQTIRLQGWISHISYNLCAPKSHGPYYILEIKSCSFYVGKKTRYAFKLLSSLFLMCLLRSWSWLYWWPATSTGHQAFQHPGARHSHPHWDLETGSCGTSIADISLQWRTQPKVLHFYEHPSFLYRRESWRWSHPGPHGLNALASACRGEREEKPRGCFCHPGIIMKRSLFLESYTFLGFLFTVSHSERGISGSHSHSLSAAFSLPYCSSAPCCSYNGKGIYPLLENGEVKPLTEQRHRPRHINC